MVAASLDVDCGQIHRNVFRAIEKPVDERPREQLIVARHFERPPYEAAQQRIDAALRQQTLGRKKRFLERQSAGADRLERRVEAAATPIACRQVARRHSPVEIRVYNRMAKAEGGGRELVGNRSVRFAVVAAIRADQMLVALL